MSVVEEMDPVADHERLVEESLAPKEEDQVEVPSPLFERMVVQELAPPEKIGGIYLPDNPETRKRAALKGRALRGRVVSIGVGKLLESGEIVDVFAAVDIEPGDVVTWHEFGGTPINSRQGLHVVSLDDCVCVERPEPEEDGEDNSDPGDEADE